MLIASKVPPLSPMPPADMKELREHDAELMQRNFEIAQIRDQMRRRESEITGYKDQNSSLTSQIAEMTKKISELEFQVQQANHNAEVQRYRIGSDADSIDLRERSRTYT